MFEQKYWDIEENSGANIYYLIPPAERMELWEAEKREWEMECRQWLDAEAKWKRAVDKWLNAEAVHLWLEAESREKNEFMMQVGQALMDRGAPLEAARSATKAAWDGYQSGEDTLQGVLDDIAAGVADDYIQRSLAAEKGAPAEPEAVPPHGADLSPHGADLSPRGADLSPRGADLSPRGADLSPHGDNPDALTSQNGHSTSSSRSYKTVKVLEDNQELHAPLVAARADARSRRRATTETTTPTVAAAGGQPKVGQPTGALTVNADCRLCNARGVFMDAGRNPVLMMCDARDSPVACQHEMSANLAYIQTMDGLPAPGDYGDEWGLGRTDLPEIDSHFPDLLEDDPIDYDEDDDVFDG